MGDNMTWNGHERRRISNDGKEGRRQADWHCGEHSIIQDTTKEHRANVCGKIKTLQTEIEKMVQWKIFAFLFSFSVLVVGAGFGFFGANLAKLADRQEESMDALNHTVSGMAATQSVMMIKVTEIEKRQDILRDQNIKIMQDARAK